MRRIILAVAGLATLLVSANTALAHGCHHPRPAVVYRAPVYRPYVAAYNPYAVPYYASPIPTYGFGVSGRNFSVWFQQ